MASESPANCDESQSRDRAGAHPCSPPIPTIALIGNPNTGKTALFNALTGYRRHVANYPGVTVDVGRGPVRGGKLPMELLDLPGAYSLAAVSPDEMVVSNATVGRLDEQTRPQAILAIVDAANLPRNLYLVSQLFELDLPVVIALNMVDIARARGIEVDAETLSRRLGVPVVPVVATRGDGVDALVAALEAALRGAPPQAAPNLPAMLVQESAALGSALDGGIHRALALRILLERDGYAERQFLDGGGSARHLEQARARLKDAGIDGPAVEVRARYAWINDMLAGVISRPHRPVKTWSDRIDRILTHKLGGAVLLLAALFILFQSVFKWAEPLMNLILDGFGRLANAITPLLPHGILESFVVDALIGGVGGVLVFLPQIMILFAFVAVLEDCGYLARAAYMVDRLMRSLGLSGRAFIPLLSSFACAVPAIMGTRVIADRRERFVTILIAPFMSCSARLPVYLLLIAAFVPDRSYLGGWVQLQSLVMLGMYLVGVVVAIPVAWLLKKAAFAGPAPGFLLELPSYKWPRARTVWQRMYFSGRHFVVRAGTIILAVNIVVWALGYFPHSETTRTHVARRARTENWEPAQLDAELAGAYLRDSYLGRMGRAIEPLVKPIGWDWRVGVAVIASFPAREVVVATLGTIFSLGKEEDEQSGRLRAAIRKATWADTSKPVFTLPVALSIMVFFSLCAQCASTLVMIARETRSRVWPVISFVGMTCIAYVAAWGTASAARAVGL